MNRAWLLLIPFVGLLLVLLLATPEESPVEVRTVSTTSTSSSTTTTAPTTTTTSTTVYVLPTTTTVRAAVARSAPIVAAGDVWDRLAACESGGRWHIFDRYHSGGLQFAYATWRQAGGTRFAPVPHEASREQQIQVAKEWLRRTSPRQWPVCGPRVGLTMADADA